MGLLQIEWVIFGLLGPRSRDTMNALLYKPMPFLKMEVIHSPGATSFNQQGRSGAVDNFLTFLKVLLLRCPEGASFSAHGRGKSVGAYQLN